MRKTGAIVLSCSVLVGVLAVAATAGADQTCQAGAYTVSTAGPVVSVPTSSTSITYTITGSVSPDHVATVVGAPTADCFTRGITSVTGSSQSSGNQSYAPGVGDPITELGAMACHEEAAKINPNGTVVQFSVTVKGLRGSTLKSVVVKKGNTTKSCAIVGIGDGSGAGSGGPTPAPVTEIIREPGSLCAVEFVFDRATGAVLDAHIATEISDPACALTKTPAEKLELQLNAPIGSCSSPPCSLGITSFGSGYAHTGNHSCTTRFIGGTVYSWGNPCP